MTDARETLEALIRERGEDYKALSRFLGRNDAYMQQFLKRGTPRKLDEDDRRKLAEYFGVDEADLGAPPPSPTLKGPPAPGLRPIPQFNVAASAGPGAHVDIEEAVAGIAFDPRWLRDLSRSPDKLSMIRVTGDSMAPTLSDGDEIMVDSGDNSAALRDGIYVLRFEDVLMVKRITLKRNARRIAIRSDNPAHKSWDDIDPDQVYFVGRVAWVGRKLS